MKNWKSTLAVCMTLLAIPLATFALAGGAQKLYASFIDITPGTAYTAPSGHSGLSVDNGTQKLKASLNGAAPVTVPTKGGGDVDLASSDVTGKLPIANGGTNSTTALSGSSIMVSDGTKITQGSAGTSATILHGNASGAPTYGAFDLSNDSTTNVLATSKGGTGINSGYTTGDILYASNSTTLQRLNANGTGNNKFLRSVSSGVPSWQQIAVDDVTGLGTGGLYYGNAGTGAALAIGNRGQVLTVNSSANAPQWSNAPAYNYLINGGFDFAQRITPATGLASSTAPTYTYALDRWKFSGEASAHPVTCSRQANSTSGTACPYVMQWAQDGTPEKAAMCQMLETSTTQSLIGHTVTFQIRMKASTSTTMRIGILSWSSTADSPTAFSGALTAADGTDFTPASNWAAQTVSNVSNTTINATPGLSAGDCSVTTSYQDFAVSASVPSGCNNLAVCVWSNANLAASQTVSFAEAGLYDGAALRDWLPRLPSTELAMCQRFYCKTFPIDTAPAQATGSGSALEVAQVVGASTSQRMLMWRFPVVMRGTAPTITTYNPTSANANFRNSSAGADSSSTAADNTSEQGTAIVTTTAGGSSAGQTNLIHISADADF